MAIYYDYMQRFVAGFHRLNGTGPTYSLTLPVRIAFWAWTDTQGTILSFQRNHPTYDGYMTFGINTSSYWEMVTEVTTLAEGLVNSTVTSTVTATSHKPAHVCIEWLSTSQHRLTIDGTDTVSDSSTLLLNFPGTMVLGGNTDWTLGTPYYSDIAEYTRRGYIEDLCIWRGISTTYLTSSEVLRLATMGRPHKYFEPDNINVYMPLVGGLYDEVNLDTVAGGGTAFWGTVPAIKTRYGAYLYVTTNPSNGDQVTIGATQYTFKTTLTWPTANAIQIAGSSGATTLDNLMKAINLTGTEGTHYGAGTTKNASCTACRPQRGNQNYPTIFILEIDDTATGTGPAISVDTDTGSVFSSPLDIDGGSVSNLAAPPEEMLDKRPDWMWNETVFASDIGVGANNHGHLAPINHGVPLVRIG